MFTGDIVVFKKGNSPQMIVESVCMGVATCVWFGEKNVLNRQNFAVEMLKVVEQQEES